MQAFLLTRLSAHYKRLFWVGIIKDFYINEDEKTKKELSDYLYDKYHCKALFLQEKSIWQNFYKKIWSRILMNCMDLEEFNCFESQGEAQKTLNEFQSWYWKEAGMVVEDNSLVIVMESFLSFVCERLVEKKNAKVALYSEYGISFEENSALFPFIEESLKNLMYCQVLAFNNYKQLKTLFTSSMVKNCIIKQEQDRGNVILTNISPKKNRVIVKSIYPGLDMNHVEVYIKKHPEFLKWYALLKKEIKGKKSVLYFENLEDFKLIEQKILYLKRFLIETGNKYHLKIFIFLNHGKKNDLMQDELFNIKDLINKINNTVFENPYETETLEDFNTIRLFEPPFSKPQICAFMALSSLFMLNNRYASIVEALKFIALTEENGVCLYWDICQMNTGFNFQSFFNYNPFKYESFKEKMKHILTFDKEILIQILNNDKSLLRKNSLLNWFETILLDLKRNPRKNTIESINDEISKPFININNNFNLHNLTPKSDLEHLKNCFQSSNNRIFIFETSTVNNPQQILSNQIDVMKTMEILSKDPKNSFFFISNENFESMEKWDKLKEVGVLAENGFYYKMGPQKKKKVCLIWSLDGKQIFLILLNHLKRKLRVHKSFLEILIYFGIMSILIKTLQPNKQKNL